MKRKQLIVAGAGAAGFFCAVNAARQDPSLQVTLLEKTGKWLSKVRVSGGGRCNVTHACYSIAEMVRQYPRGSHFLRHSFHHFFTKDTIRWFEERGVLLKTEADGRMFPVTDSSETIISCLLQEANKYQVSLRLNKEVRRIERMASGGTPRFRVELSDGSTQESDYICIACGGFAKASQHQWLEALGHSFTPPVPSLFTFNVPGNAITSLMGISVPNARVKIKGTSFSRSGPLLITHWGFSGPAVLKLSAFAAVELARMKYDFTVAVNWAGEASEQAALEALKTARTTYAAKKIIHSNPFHLPRRLWEYHLDLCGIPHHINWADLPARPQNLLAKQLCAQEFPVKGKTTFKEEFVTAGGITLSEIDPSTMQSKIVPGLFFAGEIMDIDGITGGFNFQHAWTSGFIAARSVSQNSYAG